MSRPPRIALAGNPNCGKTTLFNALTGAHQHVGNYPGVTVEKRSGTMTLGDQGAEVLDLPGTYSLAAFSPEERIAQDEILRGAFDVIAVVVDSTTLSRSLVMLAQVMLTGANAVLVLNMADEARAAGQRLDLVAMRSLLGMEVVETVGHRQQGIDELRAAITRAIEAGNQAHRVVLGERVDRALATIVEAIEPLDLPTRQHRWIASRLLLEEQHTVERIRALGTGGENAIADARAVARWLESDRDHDAAMLFTQATFGFVDGLLREVMLQAPSTDTRAWSDAIDSVLVHPRWGLPIFAAVMYAIFWLTFTLGEPPMGWIESGFIWFGDAITALWPAGTDSPLRSLLVDGILGGVGGVVIFLPNIVLLFAGLALLEDTGYMARIAFLMDRLMHRFGLHGKSFVPMMTGFGCSVPGIMATRTLENERDRLTTMMVLPLMSCGARLPIWMLLIPAFFAPPWRAPALFAIYTTGVVLALVLAKLLRVSILQGDEAPFVMELPPYRMPTGRAVLTRMSERAWVYLRKAGTVILAFSILMWVLTAYPNKSAYDVDVAVAAGEAVLTDEELVHARASEDLEHSMAGRIGKTIEPTIRPLGFDWKLGTAMIGAFAAKELFVAQMGIVYSLGETGEESESLSATLAEEYSPLTGFSLMLFLLIGTPCMATVAITRREAGSWKWAALQFGGLTGVAWLASFVVFQLGSLFL